MWIETLCSQDALDAAWLPWERLRAEGDWPGVFATAAGFRWLLRYATRTTRPWVLARWHGRRLTGLLPLLANAAAEGSAQQLQMPPLVRVPLGTQSTVFLLEVFQRWEHLGGRASGIVGGWSWPADRPPGCWAVVARWRHWAVQPDESLWKTLPFSGEPAESTARLRNATLLATLPDSCAENWDRFHWHGWCPCLTGQAQAWWQLAELLCRHDRLLLVECRDSKQGLWRFLAAREPWAAVLLAWAYQGEEEPSQLVFPRQETERPMTWFVPATWSFPELHRGTDLPRWRFAPSRAAGRGRWAWFSQGMFRFSKNKPRQRVSWPAW